jgi:hypothetical protein
VTRTLAAAAACACTALALAGSALAGTPVGVAEDATKYAGDGGASLFTTMNLLGLTSNRVSLFWDAQHPDAIQDQAFLDRMVPQAAAHGIQVVFALYAVGANGSGAAYTIGRNPDSFCSYARQVARRYPSVTKFIVGNEPNQGRFWQPQFTGTTASAGAVFESVLARCYDALKSVNPAIDVVGVGLSPNGTDRATGNHVSRSPVRFVADMAAAYKSSGRTQPLFDEFAYHCYPQRHTDTLQTGYRFWPNAGCVNLDRIKQALWDGFHGSAQKTVEDGLKIMIDETGWQVDTQGRPGYTGVETSNPVATEDFQAQVYKQLVDLANCDPSISTLHFLHLVDEADRDRFQSGLLRVDLGRRASAAAVAAEIPKGCTTGTIAWHHATLVLHPSVVVLKRNGKLYVSLGADEGFTYRIRFAPRAAKPAAGAKRAAAVERRLKTVSVSGAAPILSSAVPVPLGYGGGTATVAFTAEANPQRAETLALHLG